MNEVYEQVTNNVRIITVEHGDKGFNFHIHHTVTF